MLQFEKSKSQTFFRVKNFDSMLNCNALIFFEIRRFHFFGIKFEINKNYVTDILSFFGCYRKK